MISTQQASPAPVHHSLPLPPTHDPAMHSLASPAPSPSPVVASLSRRVALITGAAQGIGRAIALRLAQDGLDIVLSDLPSQILKLEAVASEITSFGNSSSKPNIDKRRSNVATVPRVCVVPADVTDENQVRDLVDRVVAEMGSLDVMVANAGVALLNPILETTVDEWERVFNVNVKGVMLCYKHAARVMIAQQLARAPSNASNGNGHANGSTPMKIAGTGGRLIAACSLAGKKTTPFCGTYASSKFAVRALTQTAALEFGQFGITANAYAPGLVETEMLSNMDARFGELLSIDKGVWTHAATDLSALKKLGTPEDIASVVSFLASDDSRFMTGQTLTCDGGNWFD